MGKHTYIVMDDYYSSTEHSVRGYEVDDYCYDESTADEVDSDRLRGD